MEKYHIYEEIGKGRFSQIFKGREKKNIEYVAIKRVDKNMMDKVVNEVQIIHRLESPHTIKFHDWYETRNNLWLILEYCAGGDLASLVKQDGHLPETSVRMFSLDILAGLKYLHSIGLLHCDLRLSNILIDEYGILKISDFKYTRKIPKAPLHNQPLSSRGSPKHMAPELFSSEGVHSYASDFWSLGCIVYELRCGHHPFSCRTSTAVSVSGKKTPAEAREEEEEEEEEEVLNGADEGRESYKAAVASLLERIRTRDPLSGALVAPSPGGQSSLSPALQDLLGWLLEKMPSLRCDWGQLCSHPFWGQTSPVGPKNLPQQAVYDHFLKNYCEASVTLEALEDESASASSSASSSAPTRESQGRSKFSSPSEQYTNTPASPSRRGGGAPRTVVSSRQEGGAALGSGDIEQEQQAHRSLDIVSVDILTHLSDSQVKPIVNNRAIETIEKHTYTPTKNLSTHFQPLSLEQISSLSPAKIESHLSHVYKSLQTNLGLSGSHRNMSTPSGSSQASSPAALAERANILSYLCSLSSNTDVANTILNTVFVNLLLHILKAPVGTSKTHNHSQSLKGNATATVSSKALAATALALFLRYATFVEPPKAPKDKEPPVTLLSVLVTLLRDPSLARQDALLRHRALAALGEIVFYISAQEEDRDVLDGNRDPSSNGATSENAPRWTLPVAAVTVLTKALGDESDEISRHYAAKTIENVLAQGGYLARRKFCTFDIAFRLLELSQHSRNTSIQATCAMALFHLFLTVTQKDYSDSSGGITHKKKGKSKPVSEESTVSGAQFIARVLERSGLVGYIDALRDGRPRLQQAYLNIFNLIFSPLPLFADHTATGSSRPANDANMSLSKVRGYFIKAHAQLLPSLCRLVEQGSSAIVRAKAVLAVGLSCQYHPDLTISLCDQRFHSILMKLVEPVMASAETYEREGGGLPAHGRRRGVFGKLQNAFGAQRVSSSSSIYTGHCLLFLLQVLRSELSGCLLTIIAEEGKEASSSDKHEGYNTPTKHGSRSHQPSPGSGGRRLQHEPHSSPSNAPSQQQDGRLAAVLSRTNVLKATMSLCSQPSTRRLVAGAPSFLTAVARALRLPAFTTSLSRKSEARGVAEEAVLLSLEFMSQLGGDPNILGADEIDLMISRVIPAAVQFCGTCSGDSRVVLVASLRRLLPPMVSVYCGDQNLSRLLAEEVLGPMPLASLLADQPPVPQYAVRLLTEVMDASDGGAKEVATLLLCAEDRESGSVVQLFLSSLDQWSSSGHYEGDAHVALLLSRVFNSLSPRPAPVLGRGALQLLASLTGSMHSLISGACVLKDITLLSAVLPLLSESLGFTMHLLKGEDEERAQRDIVQLVVDLSPVLPRVLSVLVWIQLPSGGHSGQASEAVELSVQQSCLQVFALFVDLTPHHLVGLLCRAGGHGHSEGEEEDVSFSYIFAAVLSKGELEGRLLLKFLGLFLRFVKTTASQQQQQHKQRVLRLLSSEPVHSSLLQCHRRDWATTASFAHLGSAREAVDALHHLSSQLLTLCGKGGGAAR